MGFKVSLWGNSVDGCSSNSSVGGLVEVGVCRGMGVGMGVMGVGVVGCRMGAGVSWAGSLSGWVIGWRGGWV